MAAQPILVVSGPPGAGKTTIAGQLAARCELSVHLATDFFYAAIRRGFIPPWKTEAARQNEVAVRAAARAAAPFARAGYVTIVDGVVLPWALAIYREELTREGLAVRCAVLLPEVDEVVRRSLGRTEDHGLDEAVYREMHRQFATAFQVETEPVVRQTASVTETTDAVLAAFAR